MEEGRKRHAGCPGVSPLGLRNLLPVGDVRRLLWWRYLNKHDRMVVWNAHGCAPIDYNMKALRYWIQGGHVALFERSPHIFRDSIAFPMPRISIEWLHAQNAGFAASDMERAANADDLSSILFMLEIKVCPDWRATNAAARNGHIRILEVLERDPRAWDSSLFKTAALYGKLDVLKWLYANYFTKRPSVFEFDAEFYVVESALCNGHINILEWLSHRFTYSEYTCGLAARNNQLATLQWLRQRGTPWDREYCTYEARSHNHIALAEWIETSK
jgi:hypothetical protein